MSSLSSVSVPDRALASAQKIVKTLSVVHRKTYATCASVVTMTTNIDALREPGCYPLDTTIPFQESLIELGSLILGKSPTFIRLIHFGSGHQMYTRECEATTFLMFMSLPLFRTVSTEKDAFKCLRQGQIVKIEAGATFRCTSERPTDMVDDMILMEVVDFMDA